MNLPEEQLPFKEPSSPIVRMQLDLAASFIAPSPKKNHGDGDQFVDDKPFIDKRKRSRSKWQLQSSGSKVARNYKARIAIFCILAAVDRFSWISCKVENH